MKILEEKEILREMETKAHDKLEYDFAYYVRRKRQIAEAKEKARKAKRQQQKAEKRLQAKNEKIENEIAMSLMQEKFQKDYDEMTL